jgi:hypothetical protein
MILLRRRSRARKGAFSSLIVRRVTAVCDVPGTFSILSHMSVSRAGRLRWISGPSRSTAAQGCR